MENKHISNIIKGIIVYPIVLLIALPIIWLFNDMNIQQTYKDLFINFWR